jgi:glycerophosphoryl diester phosphodiesterase
MILFGRLAQNRIFKIIILVIFIFYIIFINVNNGQKISNTFYKNIKNADYSTSFIAHAGGGIDGNAYTNSLEAVNNSINNFYKLIELDLLVTDDDKIVAQHDFRILEHICKKNFFYDTEKKNRKKILFNEIKNCNKIFDNKYTLLKEDQIIEIFENNKNLILVTDKIDDFKLLYKRFKFQDRLIVEVFTIKDYLKAKLYGVKNPMLLFTDGRRNILYSIFFNIKLISISTANTKKYDGFLKFLYRNKVSIFSFSSNSLEFNQKYIGKSITGVYADFWDIKNFSCNEKKRKPNVCISY